MACCSLGLPVGFSRSPIVQSFRLCPISTLDSRLVSMRGSVAGNAVCTCISFIFLCRAAMCSGVVPQQPPSATAPQSSNAAVLCANSSGPSTMPPGNPALGFAKIGTVDTARISATMLCISSGPVLQFTPTASTSSEHSVTAAVFASVPVSVRPPCSKVMETAIGRSHTSLHPKIAARVWPMSSIVSMMIKSAPASASAFACLA